MLDAMLSASAGAFRRNEAMLLAVGGGAITQSQADRVKARITPHLFNVLASTEAGIIGLHSAGRC
jgi:hypothetical protein